MTTLWDAGVGCEAVVMMDWERLRLQGAVPWESVQEAACPNLGCQLAETGQFAPPSSSTRHHHPLPHLAPRITTAFTTIPRTSSPSLHPLRQHGRVFSRRLHCYSASSLALVRVSDLHQPWRTNALLECFPLAPPAQLAAAPTPAPAPALAGKRQTDAYFNYRYINQRSVFIFIRSQGVPRPTVSPPIRLDQPGRLLAVLARSLTVPPASCPGWVIAPLEKTRIRCS